MYTIRGECHLESPSLDLPLGLRELAVSSRTMYPIPLRQSLTDAWGIVVANQAIQHILLGSNFVFSDVVRFAILGNGLAVRRAGNHSGELFASDPCTEVEARTLRTL